MARRGFSVTFTVDMNQWLFTGNPDYNAGNLDYDHIVSLYEWQSNFDDDEYHDDDIMTFRCWLTRWLRLQRFENSRVRALDLLMPRFYALRAQRSRCMGP